MSAAELPDDLPPAMRAHLADKVDGGVAMPAWVRSFPTAVRAVALQLPPRSVVRALVTSACACRVVAGAYGSIVAYKPSPGYDVVVDFDGSGPHACCVGDVELVSPWQGWDAARLRRLLVDA